MKETLFHLKAFRITMLKSMSNRLNVENQFHVVMSDKVVARDGLALVLQELDDEEQLADASIDFVSLETFGE